MDIAVNPILLIGMGGTGRNVINRFRRRLRQRVGTDRLPFIQYLYVDTDDGNLEAKSEASGVSIGIGPQDGAELVASMDSPLAMELELADSLYPQSMNVLRSGSTGGAKGVRQVGHISFLASKNLLALQTKIRNALQGLFAARTAQAGRPIAGVEPAYLTVRPQVSGHILRIYLVGSAGGGTGSSTLADMGYFVRWSMAGQAYEEDTRLFGIVGLASNWVTEDKLRGNSAGVLTELNHYLTGKGYRAAYPVSFPNDTTLPIRPGQPLAGRTPFDFTYVVEPSLYRSGALFNDPQVDVKSQRALELLEQKIAEFLLSEAVYAAADGTMAPVDGTPPPWVGTLLNEHLARLEDIQARSAESRYRQSYPAVLMTLGVTTREVPAVMHHKLAFGLAVRKLAARWARLPVPPAGAATDDLGDPKAGDLLRKWRRKLGAHEDPALYKAHRPHETGGDGLAGDELARLVLGVETGDEVRATLRGMVGRPQLVAGQTFNENDWLRETTGRINNLCMEVPDTPPLTSAGGVHARMRDRGKRLAAFDLEDGLPRQLAVELLDLAFDRDGGAGAALACSRALLERVSREAAFVTECRETVATNASPAGAGAR
ncbi:MAG: hypothetical protein HYU66_15410, partial [Armatimonadetes bacterium]|nr:hypothetical protein [Armatimonadota bacterium]